MNAFVVVALAFVAVASASWHGHAGLVGPSSHGLVLHGPSAKASLVGPDGSHISAHIPGAKLIAEPRHGGSIAASVVPGHISHGHDGGAWAGGHGAWAGHGGAWVGHAGAGVYAAHGGHDGQWVPDHNEAHYDDGSYHGEGGWGHHW